MPAVLAGLLLSLAVPAQAGEPAPRSFSQDVVPALTKAGCNSGACHGSFQGRGGFRLSLLGFDPAADFDALTREARGRRVFPALPERSLLLLKPTGAIAHGGGKRIDADAPAYAVLHDWIRDGMPGPDDKEPVLRRLEVSPREAILLSGKSLSLRVRAFLSDGRTRDVTDWALYESNKDTVASVSPRGEVRGGQTGRAALMVRYLGYPAAVSITVPSGVALAKKDWPNHNFIDDHLSDSWRQAELEPAPLCDDATFLRRVFLDLIGTLPTPDETRRFLASQDDKRRTKLVDELLERPEYAEHWALKWGDLLRAHRRSLGEKGLGSFNGWLKTALRENRPIDRTVRELLVSRGNVYKNGAAAYYFIDQMPEELAETTAQVFLGVRIGCAKCHHHPFEVWTQDDYHGLAAFFARVRRKDTKDEGLYGGSQSIGLAATGALAHPVTGKPVAPHVLGGTPLDVKEGDDPRRALADWITQRENPFFARNIVNRYWGQLFGRGLVDPIDDIRASNPASHPALLDALARDFVEHKYDLKHLLRTLCAARAYQLDSETAPKRDVDGTFFTHYPLRRLPAEVFLDAVNQAVEANEVFAGLPPGTRAINLPDPAVVSAFLDTFGRPKRATNCECERSGGRDLGQALHLVNSDKLHAKVVAPKGRVALLLASKMKDERIVEELYLATLSRLPGRAEQETIRKLLAEAPSRKEGFEDLLWTLLNTAEFGCNH